MLIIGKNEMEAGTISVRKKGEGDIGSMKAEELISLLKKEIDSKAV